MDKKKKKNLECINYINCVFLLHTAKIIVGASCLDIKECVLFSAELALSLFNIIL